MSASSSERPMDSAPVDLSVGLVTYHSDQPLLCATVASLGRAVRRLRERVPAGARVRLLVFDNGAATAPLPPLDTLIEADVLAVFDEWALIPLERNVGYGRAHNRILEHRPGEYHLVLNPDVELDEEALYEGIAVLRRRPEAVCAVPYGTNDDGQPLFLAKRYPTVLVLLLRAFAPGLGRRIAPQRMASYEMRDICEPGQETDVALASGCCMLLRSSAFVALGGFSHSFFLYFEDFDLSLRLARIGALVYVPRMRLIHHGGNAAGKGFRHILMFSRSAISFFNSHGWRFF